MGLNTSDRGSTTSFFANLLTLKFAVNFYIENGKAPLTPNFAFPSQKHRNCKRTKRGRASLTKCGCRSNHLLQPLRIKHVTLCS